MTIWLVVRERCRICGKVSIACVPSECDPAGDFECAACHNMSAEIKAVLTGTNDWVDVEER